MHGLTKFCLLLLALPVVEAQVYYPAPAPPPAPQGPPSTSRTRAVIAMDIRRAEITVIQMKRLMETERIRVKPNMDAIQACAIQVAQAEDYLRRLVIEYNQAPF